MLDAKSKYRLLGAGLFIMSAAILLPLILDGEKPKDLTVVEIMVPEKPDFPNVSINPVLPLAALPDSVDETDVNNIKLQSDENKIIRRSEPALEPEFPDSMANSGFKPLEITPADDFQTKSLAQPSAPVVTEVPAKAAPVPSKPSQAPAPAVTAPVSAPTQAAAPAVTPAGDRWTLQVAAFGSEDNAKRTLKKLQDAGYPAYVMTTNALFKVYVGPELKREASEKAKAKVMQEFKLNGSVIKYVPNP